MYKVYDSNIYAEVTKKNDRCYGLIFRNKIGEVVYDFPDISPDITFVRSIADKCNRAGLSQCHILDVIDDLLG